MFIHANMLFKMCIRDSNNPFAPAQINFLKVAVHEYIKEEEGGAVAEIQHLSLIHI